MNMEAKKVIVPVIGLVLFLTGCSFNASLNNSEDVKKQSKIEVYSASDDMLLKTIDDQDTVDLLLETYNWEETEELPEDAVPEFRLLVYQEKTLLSGQDPAEDREYELIETIITFQDSPYIKEVISSDVIKNMIIPENAMTFYYIMPEEAVKELQKLFGDEAASVVGERTPASIRQKA